MTLQIIKSPNGHQQYIRLPISIYEILKDQIDELLEQNQKKVKVRKQEDEGCVPFDPANYVQNSVALARIRAHL